MPIDPEQKRLWLREMELNGFILFRGLLPTTLVEAIHDQLRPVIQGEYSRARKENPDLGRGKERIALEISSYVKLLGGPLADPAFTRNPVVEELVDELMGPGRWQRGWANVEAAFPGSEHMSWHTDQKAEETPDLEGPHVTARLTFNIPLVDFREENGATEVIPGSHRVPRSFYLKPVSEIPNLHGVGWRLRRGDAVLRDGNMLHRGTPNRTGAVRPMLDQTYKIRMPGEE